MTSLCTTRPNEHDVQPSTADDEDGAVCSMADWWQAAYCRGFDTDTFFPLPGDPVGIRQALRICQSCPVQGPCRRYALDRRERYGIWGGLTEEAREMIMRMGSVVPPRMAA